tara:strand:+ start:275 stop:628 length:354 start_codon:yes stop_codon:yes gene_type:complete
MGLIIKITKMNKILLITIVITLINISKINAAGPILIKKLAPLEINKPQTLQKRSSIWIKGQWMTVNNEYEWKYGHWKPKKIGYVFVNGEWYQSNKGWQWKDGYWKKIDLNKWMNLYS